MSKFWYSYSSKPLGFLIYTEAIGKGSMVGGWHGGGGGSAGNTVVVAEVIS